MSRLPPYEPSIWKLSVHGDSRQRRWAKEVCRLCPDYEPFWQCHIVPLTFRPHDETNYFVRPKQKKHLLRVADASYAIFLHFTGMLRWSGLLLDYARSGAATVEFDPGLEFRPTDCLYYFFSHTYSLLESSGSFANAVNQTLEKYHAPTAFFVSRETKMSPWRFDRRGSSMVSKRWHELAALSKVYRNALVHERPLLVQSRYLPAPDAKAIAELSGLVAISRMALHERSILEYCVETGQVVDPIVAAAADLANRLWGSATESLDAIASPKYRDDQLRLRPEESHLTLKKILTARES